MLDNDHEVVVYDDDSERVRHAQLPSFPYLEQKGKVIFSFRFPPFKRRVKVAAVALFKLFPDDSSRFEGRRERSKSSRHIYLNTPSRFSTLS